MSSGHVIVPTARSLYLCDYHIGYSSGNTDLYGLFNVIRATSYPHTQGRFCVFAQLTGGLGQVPFHFDIRLPPATIPVYTTTPGNVLVFPNRHVVVQLAMELRGCTFNQPGVYLIELFCDNVWVCDVPLQLL